MANSKDNVIVVDNTTSLTSPWKKELVDLCNPIDVVGGFEAVSKLRQNESKCVVVNTTLNAYFNGVDVIKRVREKFKSIPIIAIVNPGDKIAIKNIADLKVQVLINAPVNPEEFRDKLSQFITSPKKEPEKQPETVIKAQDFKNNGEDEIYTKIPEKYYEAQSCFARGEFDNAIKIFSKISEEKKLKTDLWLKYVQDSLFQLGRCLISKSDFQKAIDALSLFLQRAAKSEFAKQALFYIGQSYESLKNNDKAINFYRKVIQMGEFDPIATQAKKRIKIIQENQ